MTTNDHIDESPALPRGFLTSGQDAAMPDRFAGHSLDTPVLMGIVNVTPDSFSDGGQFFDAERAITHARQLANEGAAILDVGGESTRPGADPVSPDDEIARVLPVVRTLAGEGYCVSIDTRRALVMKAAVECGAAIINDVTALEGDSQSLSVAAASQASVILIHMQGDPGTMQQNPQYDDVAMDIFDYLKARVVACEKGGISRNRIAVDPGIGFGKTLDHNLQIISRLGIFRGLGCPIVLGVSRKRFIGLLDNDAPVGERLAGSLAAALRGISEGAGILRVHDVAETRQALNVWQAIKS